MGHQDKACGDLCGLAGGLENRRAGRDQSSAWRIAALAVAANGDAPPRPTPLCETALSNTRPLWASHPMT